ncbi:MAG TPA: PAS domain S-box protein [Bryobacteraceae bacterium]|nr:PAS domain S-box protein [Bryobacteraceae bacterium]
MAAEPDESNQPAEQSWAWQNLDAEIRIPLANRVDHALAGRSVPGAMVYFAVCIVLFFTTPFYRDHPVILLTGSGWSLIFGLLRLATALRLKKQSPRQETRARFLFLFANYALFAFWGLLCAWTLRLYPGQWTSMLLLLSTASMAGGITSSLAPNLNMALRCLVLLVGPTVISGFTFNDNRYRAIGGLAAMYLAFLLGQARDSWRAFWSASVAAEKEKLRGSAARRKAEREKASLVTAIEQAAEEIFITDADGIIQYCNPSFEQVTGYSREEALGKNPRFLKSGRHDAAFYENLWQTIKNGGVWTGRMVNRRKDGTYYEAEGTISAIHDSSGRLTGFVSARHDVTELLQLESQLRQSQKMESIGRLAGGVAHDFNNLLTVISGYGDMLMKSLAPSDPRRRYVEGIHKAAESASSLTQQLLAFGRKQIIQPRALDLNGLIADTSELLRRLLGEDIELMTMLDPAVGRVVMDPEQTIHVLMNLAANARDAMPEGGSLMLRTSNVAAAEIPAAAPLPNEAVRLSVVDTGCGMDEETRQHIFEPFFTTKEKGRGTGLGLSTVYGIVRQSGGWIEVHSDPGQGTAFHLYFPRAGAATPLANTAAAAAPAALKGSETILVVEDVPEIRALMIQILESKGFRVLSAANGEEGLRRARDYQGAIDLLLTDVIMPGITGKQMADQLAAARPAMKVLYTTGYSWEVIADRGVLDVDVPYLPKPFTPDSLIAKVRQVLGPLRKS